MRTNTTVSFISCFLFLLFCLLMTGCRDSSPVFSDADTFLGVPILSETDYQSLIEKRKEAPDTFAPLCFAGNPLPHETDTGYYFLPQTPGNDWDTGGLSCSHAHIAIHESQLTSDTTAKAFLAAEGRALTFLLYNETAYATADIIVTTLPVITLTDIPDSNSDQPMAAHFSLYDPERGITDSAMEIHVRGGTSRLYPKKNYKIDLVTPEGNKNKISLLGMRQDSDWILTAMYADESKIRDKLTYDLWIDLTADRYDYDFDNGVHTEYVEVILNGRYWGLYLLSTPINKQSQHLLSSEILIKNKTWEIPTIEQLLSAGESTACAGLELKKPDEASQEIWNCVADLFYTIFETSNDDFKANILQYVNLDNLLDYWLMVNLSSGGDNTWKNCFITFKQNPDRSYTAIFTPWDCDLTWGLTWVTTDNLCWRYADEMFTKILYFCPASRVIENDAGGALSRLKSRWSELTSDEGIFSQESLFSRVERLTSITIDSGAYMRDHVRWPQGGYSDDDNAYIKYFIPIRLRSLNEFITSLPDHN